MVLFAQSWLIKSYKGRVMMCICLQFNWEIKADRWRWPTYIHCYTSGLKLLQIILALGRIIIGYWTNMDNKLIYK